MKERLPIAAMPGLLRQPHPGVPLGLYRHTKSGGQYVVVGGTFLATGEDQQVFVQYICSEHGYSAHRTPEDFLGPSSDVSDTPRFVLVREMIPLDVAGIVLAAMAVNARSGCAGPAGTGAGEKSQ